MPGSQLLIHDIQDATVVNFRYSAILDSATIGELTSDLLALVDQQAVRKLVLDFSDVKFISSQVLGVLLGIKSKSDAIRGQLVICGLKPELKRIFKIMNLQRVFRFYETEQEALASLDVYTA